MKPFKYVKSKLLKRKENIVHDISYILNGVLVHSVNLGRGFYINDPDIDSDKSQHS